MNVRTTLPMDNATFFRWLERQEQRHELVDGVPRTLPNVTRHHERITANLVIVLGRLLDLARHDIAHGDFAIQTGESTVRYADIMVHEFSDSGDDLSTTAALLLIEVLSDSTRDIDFSGKLTEYSALAGVQQYVVLAQDRSCAWSWVRQEDGRWPNELELIEGLGASIAVPSLGIALPLAEVYSRVPLR